MKKLLIILICIISFECYAVDASHQREEALGLGKAYFNKLITKKIYHEKLQACSSRGNKTCSTLLGIQYYHEEKYSQAGPLLISGENFSEIRYCF